MMRRFLSLVVVIQLSLQLHAQKQANNWAFTNTEFNFNRKPLEVTRNFATRLNRGIGIISDVSGNLVLYTDGYTIWNKNHVVMQNGSNLIPATGKNSVQSSLVVPKPGSDHIYYVFTVDPWNGQSTSGLYYSEVDASAEGGQGVVTVKGVRLINDVTAKLNAVFHSSGTDVWVMTHRKATNTYAFVLVTAAGLDPRINEQSIGTVHGGLSLETKFSPDGTKLAVPLENGIQIMDFDASSGRLSNVRVLPKDDIYDGAMLGAMEFSSDAAKLYVFEHYSKRIYQFDMLQSSAEGILASKNSLNKSIGYNSPYQFQLATDGNIYMTKGGGGGGTSYIGSIANACLPVSEVQVKENDIYLNGGDSFVNRTPAFIQNWFYRTSFRYDKKCQYDTIAFKVTNLHELLSVKWDFGDGAGATVLNPTHKYLAAGKYTVKLIAYYEHRADTIARDILIDPVPVLDLGSDRLICDDTKLSVSDIYRSYAWSTGDTIPRTRVRGTGAYSLSVKNQFGCFSSDTVNVTAIALPRVAFPDSIVRTGSTAVTLDAGTFSAYQWSTGAATPSITVTTDGWYSVTATNGQGCEAAKSVYVGTKPAVSVQGTEWIRLNPKPSARPGSDMYFLDDQTGFIVNGGEILRTRNAGESWEILMPLPMGKRMAFKGTIGYVVGNQGTVYRSTHRGDAWNRLIFPSTENLNAVSVVHQDTVLITSDTKLFVSNDAGRTWQTFAVPGIDIEDSFFTSAKVGHVAGRNGMIRKTIDGGRTWYSTQTSNTFPSDFYAIRFLNKNTGFASQEHSTIYKTTDGGETWKVVSNITVSGASFSIQILDELKVFLCGEYGTMHKTLDGGLTWKRIALGPAIAGTDVKAIFFVDEKRGFATGLRGLIAKTTNGGNTWQEYGETYQNINQIDFVSNNVGYVSIATGLFKTEDKGQNWTNMKAPLSGHTMGAFDFINEQTGFAVVGGEAGTSATAGMVYRTNDGGLTWAKTHAAYQVLSSLNCIEFIDDRIGLVGGPSAVMKTADGGVTWKNVSSMTFGQIQFITPMLAYARSTASIGAMYKTVDGGETWNLNHTSDNYIRSFHFFNERVGYFVGDGGTSYKTVDGGNVWTKVNISSDSYAAVRLASPDTVYVANGSGQIRKTADGGVTWKFDLTDSGNNKIETFGADVYVGGVSGSLLTSRAVKPLVITPPVVTPPVITPPDTTDNLDPIAIDMPSMAGVTETTASLVVQFGSYDFQSATLYVQIGTTSGTYDQTFEVATLNGIVDDVEGYDFSDLAPETTYYVRLMVVQGTQTVVTSEISFTTARSEVPEEVTSVEDPNDRVEIYPNPASQSILIDFYGPGKFSYMITDALGKVVTSGEAGESAVIDVTKLNAGVYLLVLQKDGDVIRRRIIKS